MPPYSYGRFLAALGLSLSLVACGGGGNSKAPATDTTPPGVVALSPAAGSDRVDVGSSVSVTFREAIDCATVSAASFTLLRGTRPVSGVVSCSGATATFTPDADFTVGTIYTATVSKALADSAGNTLADDLQWRFTTGWVETAGAATRESEGTALATDASGNVYQGGYIIGQGIFVAKYDAQGDKLWQADLASSFARLEEIAIDASGNVYATGNAWTTLDGVAMTGNIDLFLVKIAATGSHDYTKLLGYSGAEVRGKAVTLDGAGNVYVAGYTNAGVNGLTMTGAQDALLVKFDAATGNLTSARQYGVASKEAEAQAIWCDGTHLYLTGRLRQDSAWDTLLLSYAVSDLSRDYDHVIDLGDNSTGNRVLSSGSDLYVAGTKSGPLFAWQSGYLFKCATDGTGCAAPTPTELGSTWTGINAMAMDGSGNLYVTGFTGEELDGAVQGYSDLMLARYDGALTRTWVHQYGATDVAAWGNALAVSGDLLYVAGAKTGAWPDAAIGIQDAFVIQYDLYGGLP